MCIFEDLFQLFEGQSDRKRGKTERRKASICCFTPLVTRKVRARPKAGPRTLSRCPTRVAEAHALRHLLPPQLHEQGRGLEAVWSGLELPFLIQDASITGRQWFDPLLRTTSLPGLWAQGCSAAVPRRLPAGEALAESQQVMRT